MIWRLHLKIRLRHWRRYWVTQEERNWVAWAEGLNDHDS